jgi:hypothetical protein
MTFRSKNVLFAALLIGVLACASTAFLVAHVGSAKTTEPSRETAQTPIQIRSKPTIRNLSLQPEAFKFSRRIGKRFMSAERGTSVLAGSLKIGTDQQVITIIRAQTDTGEKVEIRFGSSLPSLTWSDDEGTRATAGSLMDAQRLLIERLTFDSADQFVLAQLRGASYYTIARDVRAGNDAGDENYSGPLWDIVRVENAEDELQKKPLSQSRLYYINSKTGLIDKVSCELRGERIEAVFSDWVDVAGEKTPSHIIWKRDGNTLMEFTLNNFTRLSAE